jgi:hypothetical protein
MSLNISSDLRNEISSFIYDKFKNSNLFIAWKTMGISKDRLEDISKIIEDKLFRKAPNAEFHTNYDLLPFRVNQMLLNLLFVGTSKQIEIINFNVVHFKENFLSNVTTIVSKFNIIDDMNKDSYTLSYILCLVHAMKNGMIKEHNPKFLEHLFSCKDSSCKVRFCSIYKVVLNHYYNCKNYSCKGCLQIRKIYLRNILMKIFKEKISNDVSKKTVEIVKNHFDTCSDRKLCGCQYLFGNLFESKKRKNCEERREEEVNEQRKRKK